MDYCPAPAPAPVIFEDGAPLVGFIGEELAPDPALLRAFHDAFATGAQCDEELPVYGEVILGVDAPSRACLAAAFEDESVNRDADVHEGGDELEAHMALAAYFHRALTSGATNADIPAMLHRHIREQSTPKAPPIVTSKAMPHIAGLSAMEPIDHRCGRWNEA